MFNFGSYLKDLRNKHQTCLTYTFYALMVLLLISSIGWAIFLFMFLGSDMFKEGEQTLKKIHNGGMVYLLIGSFILLAIIGTGSKLNSMKAPNNWMVALFGLFTLLIGVVPFYGQAKAILDLGGITKPTIWQ